MGLLNKLQRKTIGENENDFSDLGEDDVLFLVSLYPKGRHIKSIFRQLKEKYPSTRDDRIKVKVNRWTDKMKDYGLVTVINADVGEIISLTKKGIQFTRNKIVSYKNENTEKFVEILNRLLSAPDSWAVDYYRRLASNIVHKNMPLFTVIFDFKPMERAISDLNDTFDMRFDKNRYRKFKDALERMEILGLLDIEYQNDTAYIGATSISRDIISEITNDLAAKSPQHFKKNIFEIKKLVLPVVLSCIVSAILIGILLSSTTFITREPVITYYTFALLPILVPVFYWSIIQIQSVLHN